MRQGDVLIAGATGVIGQAIVQRLYAQGYSLHFVGRSKERLALIQSLGALDSADFSQPSTLVNAVERFFTRAQSPYAMVIAAGNLGASGTFAELNWADWKTGVDENFYAPALMIHEFVRLFQERHLKGGAIVTFSGAGLGGTTSFARVSSYSTAKAALTHLVEALGDELQPIQLSINAIAPGAVLSGITEQAIQAGESRLGAYAIQAEECKRTGGVSPDLAAQLVEFLLSPDGLPLTGRLLSARFDLPTLRAEAKKIALNPDYFRLRRIDYSVFEPKGKR